jgi:ribosome maturation factor RimP
MEKSIMGTAVPYFYTVKMTLKEKITELIEQVLKEKPDIFVMDLNISENNDIHLILDGDKGVNIDDIVYFSRQIEHNLDRDETDFSLTVSSVDITKPFYLKRQYHKNLNRNLKVKTPEGEKQGKLIHIDDDAIVLEYQVREPKKTGKGKITVTKQDRIKFDNIKEAKVVLKF